MLYTYPLASISGAFICSFYILLFTFSLLTSFLLLSAESTLDIWRGRKTTFVFSKPMHWPSTPMETPDSSLPCLLAKIWLNKTCTWNRHKGKLISLEKKQQSLCFCEVSLFFSLKTSSFGGWDLELYVDWNRREDRLDSLPGHCTRRGLSKPHTKDRTASSPTHSTATAPH